MRPVTVGLADKIRKNTFQIYQKSGHEKIILRHIAHVCSCSPVPVYGAFGNYDGMLHYCLKSSVDEVISKAEDEHSHSLLLDFDLALLKCVATNRGFKEEFTLKASKVVLEKELNCGCEKLLNAHKIELTKKMKFEVNQNTKFIYNFVSLLHPGFLEKDNSHIFENVIINLHKHTLNLDDKHKISVEF